MIALNPLLGTGSIVTRLVKGLTAIGLRDIPSVFLSPNKQSAKKVSSLPSSLVPFTPTKAEGTRMAQMFGLATNESSRTALPSKATF
jgi:hypothetical protein